MAKNTQIIEKVLKPEKKSNSVVDWILRLVKGFIVGFGAITPGLSGGVLAVILGIYEPIMRFLGNLTDRFWKRLLYFIPIGIGGMAGVIIFSKVVADSLEKNKAPFIWLFLGFIVGTLPSLIKNAGSRGRKSWHGLVLLGVAGAMVAFLLWMRTITNVSLPQTWWSWLLSGLMIGLGVIVPGLSPSNFLMYLHLYEPMSRGIGNLNLGVILPVTVGVLVSVLLLARFVSKLFDKAYGLLYNIIIGTVIGSSIAIAIIEGPATPNQYLVCILAFIVGAAASFALSRIDEKHPHESLF
jgi:putative membrane protein